VLLAEHREAVQTLSHDITEILTHDRAPASRALGRRVINEYVEALDAGGPERTDRWSAFLRRLDDFVRTVAAEGEATREPLRRLESILDENADLTPAPARRHHQSEKPSKATRSEVGRAEMARSASGVFRGPSAGLRRRARGRR
jgi:hypothetical protein